MYNKPHVNVSSRLKNGFHSCFRQTYGALYHPVEPAPLQYVERHHHEDKEQDLHKIPGVPGIVLNYYLGLVDLW